MGERVATTWSVSIPSLMILSATSQRMGWTCSARKTALMPSWPSSSSSLYFANAFAYYNEEIYLKFYKRTKTVPKIRRLNLVLNPALPFPSGAIRNRQVAILNDIG